jgi:hypothetical protein
LDTLPNAKFHGTRSAAKCGCDVAVKGSLTLGFLLCNSQYGEVSADIFLQLNYLPCQTLPILLGFKYNVKGSWYGMNIVAQLTLCGRKYTVQAFWTLI